MCEKKENAANIPGIEEQSDEKSAANIMASKTMPKISKLDADCLHEIFDYLPLIDLVSVGQTCKRMQFIAGEFFRLNYKAAHIYSTDYNGIDGDGIRLNIFTKFIEKMAIYLDVNSLKEFRYIGSSFTKSLNQLKLVDLPKPDRIDCIKGILAQIEVLELNDCDFEHDFYEHFLKYCVNVKSLTILRSIYIRDKATIIGTGNDWLHRKYPQLTHIRLAALHTLNTNELAAFLEINPNVRSFSTDSKSLWKNRFSLLTSNAKLDQLAISFYYQDITDPFHSLLLDLHASGFYHWLQIYFSNGSEHDAKHRIFTLPTIEMLSGTFTRVDHSLINLKELNVSNGLELLEKEVLAKNLINLERIYFFMASCDDILPFIRHSIKLNKIRIECVLDRAQRNANILNLSALNIEREKLENAWKVKIYVKENIYLPTKWTMREINFDFVEMKRIFSFEWGRLNHRFRFREPLDPQWN